MIVDNVIQQDGKDKNTDEGTTTMLLKTKLANQIKAIDPSVEMVKAKNVNVNGAKRGCTGFCVKNGKTIYFATDALPMFGQKDTVMWRYAKDTNDYSSIGIENGANRWCEPGELASQIVKALQ